MIENNTLSIQNLTDEIESWFEETDSRCSTQLDVFVDLKSPHAYLAIRPSLEVARDFKVQVNFLPFTLSYESLGLSTRVAPDMKRRPANAAADRKARMYYAAAREYAQLQGLPFRTPHRLLDSDLAHRFMLFAKQQNRELQFMMNVYLKGWSNGWRDFELESYDKLTEALMEVSVSTNGLEKYIREQAPSELAALTERAESSGAVGVPHYVCTDPQSQRVIGLFGREHLALLRGKFAAAGLARSAKVRAEFSHAWPGPNR